MNTLIILTLLLLALMLLQYGSYIAHILNNIFNLPHPGPNDIQGSCSCREHEGPNKYTFSQYVNQSIEEKKIL